MLKLYKFYWDCGRQGNIESVFVADENKLNSCIGKEVYFGEILGKHSGTLEESYFEIISEDQEFIHKLLEIFDNEHTISGYNPLDYLREDRL